MKKTGKIIVSITAAMCFALPLASCGGGDILESPTGFNLDDNYNLSWSRVENARSYLLSIVNLETGATAETTSRRENIALSYLDMGDYDIRIRAVGDGSRFYDSDWSAIVSLNRAYESGCQYQLINNGSEYEVSGVSTSGTKDLVMEDTYRGKPVTSVGKGAFRGARTLETLVLGKNVTSIGAGAFYSCSALKSISIPDTVTNIDTEAFRACSSLETFTVPADVTELKNSTFAYCRGLKEIELNNVTVIGESVFDNCSGLEEFTFTEQVREIGVTAFSSATALKEVTLGSGVESIGRSAFAGCKALETINFSENGNLKTISDQAFHSAALSSVELPEGLESIGASAFTYCGELESVTIPDSVTVVGANAFYETKIYKNAVAAGEKIVYVGEWIVGFVRDTGSEQKPFNLINKDDPNAFIDTYVFREDTVGIADRTFAGTAVQDVKLSENIKYVGAGVFNLCNELTRFDASESNIEILDVGAFAYSGNLSDVYLNPSDRNKKPTLKVIGDYAFRSCESLNFNTGSTSARFIPETVERIGSYAFYDSGFYKPENVSDCGVVYADDWVVGCTGTYTQSPTGWQRPEKVSETITLKTDENGNPAVRGIADYAFYNCMAITTFENFGGIQSIGRGAFYNCINLGGLPMSTSNLRTIDDYAFYGCSSLSLSTLPRYLQTIGRSAFYGCTGLDSVMIRNAVTSIGDFAFYGCTNLASVSFGSGLTEIGDYAFYGTGLEELIVPSNIKTIGDSAFRDCSSLETVTFEEGVETIGSNAFRADKALTKIVLPESVKTVGDNAFLQCVNVESIDLGSVERIGDYAFAEIGGVKNLSVPESVKTIGRGAFYLLGSTVDGDGVVHAGLQSVTLGGSIDKIGAHAFYGLEAATIFVQDENREADWGTGWNSSRRPVIWGVALSDDKSYVVSFTVGEGTFEYFGGLNAPCGPYREGYVFAGWSLTENGTEIAYTAENVMDAPLGTTLYAVYMQA